MDKVFFIGDLHFWHHNIIKYCNRPFQDTEDMTECLIKNWNSTVGKNDIVYVVGDFALCGKQKLVETARRLNGRKRLILGNHDRASHKTYEEAGFERIYDCPIILDNLYLISHIPLEGVCGPYVNIFAHIHTDSAYPDVSRNGFCVSAERIQYTPIDFEEIKKAVIEKCAEEVLNWLIE